MDIQNLPISPSTEELFFIRRRANSHACPVVKKSLLQYIDHHKEKESKRLRDEHVKYNQKQRKLLKQYKFELGRHKKWHLDAIDSWEQAKEVYGECSPQESKALDNMNYYNRKTMHYEDLVRNIEAYLRRVNG